MPQMPRFVPYTATQPIGDDYQPPSPPSWLTDGAKEAWQRLAPHAKPTPADVDEFAAYCEAISEFQAATGEVKATGLLIADMEGNTLANPALAIRDSADAKLSKWSQRFRWVK